MERYYVDDLSAANKRFLILVSDRGLDIFKGEAIPGVCMLDGNPEHEQVLLDRGVQAVKIHQEWLDKCPNWERLKLFVGLAEMKDVKWIVGCLFPECAIRLDLGIDIGNYEIVRMRFYDTHPKKPRKLIEKCIDSSSRVIKVESFSIPNTTNNWTDAKVLSPKGSMLRSVKYLSGNGNPGIWELEIAVPLPAPVDGE